MYRRRPLSCFLARIVCLFIGLVGAGHAGDVAKTVRVMTVVIVQQDEFLQQLLEPYLADHNLQIEYRTGHHRELVQAVKDGEVDLIMLHTKIKAMDKLTGQGLLNPGQAVFANPKAFLGPAGDPAKLQGLTDPVLAMQHIREAGKCFVINPHGKLETQQRDYLQKAHITCVIDDAKDTEQALDIAAEKDGYTIWGLHPYLAKGQGRLEPVVIPHEELLQNIGVWVVAGTAVEQEASGIATYLLSDQVRKRYPAFRLKNQPNVQAWWPPVH